MSINYNSFKTFKPITPSMRGSRLLNRKILRKNKGLKKLRYGYLFGNGRNNQGHITSWQKGGGHKRLYRKISFLRDANCGIVAGLEYDPNRNSWISRIFNPDIHDFSYILGVKNLNNGDCLQKNITFGTNLLLKDLPSGFVIHNLSTGLNKKGQYLRAAGAYGQLIAKTTSHACIKLRSGEHRLFSLNASATLGSVVNEDFKFTKIGKAGRIRWYGVRPHVRGVAINPVDHPHGGGEGRTSGGRPSVTPWGKPTKGQPTLKKFNTLRVKIKKKHDN